MGYQLEIRLTGIVWEVYVLATWSGNDTIIGPPSGNDTAINSGTAFAAREDWRN
jgi:hypothetical protein